MGKILSRSLLAGVIAAAAAAPALAWDSVGHRVSALVANEYLEPEARAALIGILREHPRFDEDFLDQVPSFIDVDDQREFEGWLLGQAAFWPDIARGLPSGERDRYHRGNWHYIDGAWLRGAATEQGNNYAGIAPLPSISGIDAKSISAEAEVDNIVLALDYNMALLSDQAAEPGRRAVALCWILHLVGDIHQPLHTGSPHSARLFRSGDAGGNGIDTDHGNLHATWDRALREQGILASVEAIIAAQRSLDWEALESEPLDWTAWMAESRELVTSVVYTEAMLREILEAEAEYRPMREIELSEDYLDDMRQIAEQRLGLAGARIALLANSSLAAAPQQAAAD